MCPRLLEHPVHIILQFYFALFGINYFGPEILTQSLEATKQTHQLLQQDESL